MAQRSLDIFYASHFGHTERIARTLEAYLRAAGEEVRTVNLARTPPAPSHLRSRAPCVLIAAVRYGVHLPAARRLLKQIAPLTPAKPLVLLSVNLTARKPGKRSATGNAYLRKWIRTSGAHPVLAEAIAGKLEYPRYNPFDRTMIRFIMAITGGPADGKCVVDYTPWSQLADLAGRIRAVL